MNDGEVLAAELRVATAQWRVHTLGCRRCKVAGPDTESLIGRVATGHLCPTGQRLHGAVQGHRARIHAAAHGGRPHLRLIRGAA